MAFKNMWFFLLIFFTQIQELFDFCFRNFLNRFILFKITANNGAFRFRPISQIIYKRCSTFRATGSRLYVHAIFLP